MVHGDEDWWFNLGPRQMNDMFFANICFFFTVWHIIVKHEHELNIDVWNIGFWKEGTVISKGFLSNNCWCGEGINHQHLLPTTYPDKLVIVNFIDIFLLAQKVYKR